jgi:fatty-acyl-CoA synthase
VSGRSVSKTWLCALEATAPIAANPHRILPRVIEDLAETRGDLPALLSTTECLTYRALAQRANRTARWALDQGIAKGDTVCLMMRNRPEYLAIWLGLTSVGVVVSLINTHLRGPSLAHCIDIVGPQHIIVADDLIEEFRSAVADLTSHPKIWSSGGETDIGNYAVDRYSAERLTPSERREVTIADRALLIYTSGTTGMPKAAKVSHRRLLEWSFWFAGLMNTGPDDRMYDCLPMYHSVGGVVAPGAALVRGGSVLIRDKFSTKDFWDDVINGDCTLFQYIGELCRYLVNAPEHSRERDHRLRLCCGNGLRADVWERFQQRFAIPRILEFYAATEGNVSLYNVEGRVGAIGRIPSFLTHRFPLVLVKFDAVAGMPARDARGLCVRCRTDEIGEAIGRMDDLGTEFEGYTDPRASEQKVLRDVFEHGDAWYRFSDLMRQDANGFFYFIDRIGDTFRWKGENVASLEVAAAIGSFPGIKEASVYGVRVPGIEGAAGMAAIVVDGELNLAALREYLAGRLPAYARPVFLRVMDRIELTSTFKYVKNELAREGYDPAMAGNTLYFDDPVRQAFVQLDGALYAQIQAGLVRL